MAYAERIVSVFRENIYVDTIRINIITMIVLTYSLIFLALNLVILHRAAPVGTVLTFSDTV